MNTDHMTVAEEYNTTLALPATLAQACKHASMFEHTLKIIKDMFGDEYLEFTFVDGSSVAFIIAE